MTKPQTQMPPAPPSAVRQAFGVEGMLERLPGGNGETWRAGDVVLKHVRDEREAAWLCEFTASLPQRGFRVALPRRSRLGAWVVNGWTAATWLAGEHRTDRWAQLFDAADAFHAAARSTRLPSVLKDDGWELRTPFDRWRFADRVAWGEVPPGELSSRPEIRMLLDKCQPVDVSSQLVHCDLAGNVLFAEGLAPAIIDHSLYWRPLAYSAAITFADAATFEGAPLDTVKLLERYPAWRELLIRGVLFRVVVNELARRFKPDLDTREPFVPIIEVAIAANA